MALGEQKKEELKRFVFNSEGVSRKEAAEAVGLDVRTASGYMDELLGAGYIRGESVKPEGKGRPTVIFYPDFENLAYIGMAITRESISCSLFDFQGGEISKKRLSMEAGRESKLKIFNRIREMIKNLIAEIPEGKRLGGVGVSCSRWLRPPLAEYDIYSEITDFLSRHTGVPIYRDIPINVVMYDLKTKHPEIHNSAVFHPGIIMETGTLINDNVARDFVRYEYDFAHFPVYKNGVECYCGQRGCLEHYASVGAFAEKFGSDEIWKSAREGDRKALEILEFSASGLGKALAGLAEKFSLDSVWLGWNDLESLHRKVKKSFLKEIKNKNTAFNIVLPGETDILNAAASMASYNTVKRYIKKA